MWLHFFSNIDTTGILYILLFNHIYHLLVLFDIRSCSVIDRFGIWYSVFGYIWLNSSRVWLYSVIWLYSIVFAMVVFVSVVCIEYSNYIFFDCIQQLFDHIWYPFYLVVFNGFGVWCIGYHSIGFSIQLQLIIFDCILYQFLILLSILLMLLSSHITVA